MTTKNTEDFDIEPIIKYVATAGVLQYPFGFRVFSTSDIEVYLDDELQRTGYSVILTENIRGGNVVFDRQPAAGSLITILANVPYQRDSDFNEAGTFRAKVVNKELDIVMALLRQLRNDFSLSAHLPPFYKGLNLELPIPQAGHSILWNLSGDGFVNSKDNIDNLYTDTKAQADLAVEKAQIATEKAEISTQKAAAAALSATDAANTVNGFDTHAADMQNQYNANAATKLTAFDNNAASLTKDFNANASEKLEEYNSNHLTKIKNYNDNHDSKLAIYNNNAVLKQAAVDASALAAAQSAAAAETTLNQATGTIDTAKTKALDNFNSNAEQKTAAFNENSAVKVAAYNANAEEKQAAVNASADSAAASAEQAKIYRDEAQEIANMPQATEQVLGAAYLATAEEVQAGLNNSKIVVPSTLKLVADSKAPASHLTDVANPHAVTKAQIGLGNVDDTSDLNKPISNAVQTALNSKAAIEDFSEHTNNNNNPHAVTKTQIGLGNVDNTSDLNKPISSAVELALNAKAPLESPVFTGAPTVPNQGVGNNSTRAANTAFVNNFQPLITSLTATSGTISLEINKIYTMTIEGATTFSLPAPSNRKVFNQIKILLKVTGTPTINWGTSSFFNKTTPEIEAGSYDVYFDYDELHGCWVCGTMRKGVAS